MKIRFLKLAKKEFDWAISYYNREQKDLGFKFKSEIKSSIENILKFPNLYPIVGGDLQKCVTHTFPFTIFYTIHKDIIVIVAVANHYKKPEHYLNREIK